MVNAMRSEPGRLVGAVRSGWRNCASKDTARNTRSVRFVKTILVHVLIFRRAALNHRSVIGSKCSSLTEAWRSSFLHDPEHRVLALADEPDLVESVGLAREIQFDAITPVQLDGALGDHAPTRIDHLKLRAAQEALDSKGDRSLRGVRERTEGDRHFLFFQTHRVTDGERPVEG